MKNLTLLIVFLFLGIVVGGGVFIWNHKAEDLKRIEKITEPPFTIEHPPNNSERGMIRSMKGLVKWESRVATEASQITMPVPIMQAEKLETGDDSEVAIHFESGLDISLSQNAQIEFTQTHLYNFVFNQLKGSIEYQKSSSIPLGVRTRRLLTTVDKGDVIIVLDDATGNVEVIIKKGSAKVAFNNSENISTVMNIKEGETLKFDHEAHEGTIKE